MFGLAVKLAIISRELTEAHGSWAFEEVVPVGDEAVK